MPVHTDSIFENQAFSSGSAADDAGLVERASTGDADAFGQLYLQHLDAIYRYIYFRVGETRDAEDLTEQVFLKAWEALPEYQNVGFPFSSWLYRIAHNMVVDHHRRKKPVVPMAAAPPEEWDQKQSSMLSQVIDSEETAALAGAISKLPDDQQQVILLRFVEGLNHSEIARMLNKSDGACRMIQYRALANLNQLLNNL